ncbi:MAG: 1-deoxy-D-xylulose-5-phosphate reductoisomerase [candidate division Zixibacteria bacterium]|nr:1-deoxy-D-xylulose-5-phosphate reductoisomerase [candidate division Zixibacteria bacterium]
MKNLVILGSTGSIGRNALDIIDRNPGRFRIIGLTANRNAELLAAQARKYNPSYVALCDRTGLSILAESINPAKTKLIDAEDVSKLCSDSSVDIVLNAVVGFAGLKATAAALIAGKKVALANKESMVAAGPLLNRMAATHGGEIIPIDSEHSAIFQCLASGKRTEVARLILTSSGGPFFRRENFDGITPEEALKHPTWNMGPKITIDSATLMNKGLEIIEAAYLFDIPADRIEVVIHPQSVVHSMVEFIDGSTIAQLSKPDMRLPIQYALFYPERIKQDLVQFDFSKELRLDFYPPPKDKFRSLELAYRAVREAGISPAVFNAANEQAVKAFLDHKIQFKRIFDIVEETMNRCGLGDADTLEQIFTANSKASHIAGNIAAEFENTDKF